MQLEPIRPLEYITNRDPIPEEVMDTTSWFETERMELDVGEYVGRPQAATLFHTSFIMPLLADGWRIDSVLSSGDNGEWVSTATATASQTGSATNNSSSQNQSNSSFSSSSKSTSKSSSRSDSAASSKAVSKQYGVIGDGFNPTGGGESSGNSSGRSESSSEGSGENSGNGNSSGFGSATGTGSSSTSGSSQSVTTQDGGPWWCAYVRIRLVRRHMRSEYVLKDMIASFTKAYNEGRQINDERYDELVALYAIMLSRTEDEANAFGGLSADDFKPLADAVIAACKDAMEKYGASADNIPADWMQSRIDEINRKFDALVAQAKSEMVSKGTYNSTVWPTIVSGIERDRQIALNGLKDEMVTLKVDVLGKIAAMKADIGQKLLDCEIRIIEAQQKMLLGPTEIRNTVFKWMLDFMERREDEYPGLEQLATIAGQLGYAEGGMGGS